jgi:hypothetical protein
MITFRPMTLLAVTSSAVARRSPMRGRTTAAAASCLILLAVSARAQTTLSHTEDAAPVPQGMLRVRITTGWTRFDQRYADGGGLSMLGSELSTDSLGPRQLPRLTPIEMGIKTLTGDPAMRLTLGRLETRSDARIVTTPIAVEFGVTRRLSVGVMVPVVQTRQTVTVLVNRDTLAAANMGYVQRGQRIAAAAANAQVVAAYQSAANDLAALIARCQTTPTGAGCAAVVANPSDASAALAQARAFATAASALGVDSAHAHLAPRSTSKLKDSIEVHRLALNQRLEQYLGAGRGAQTSLFFASGANDDFAYLDLQGGSGVGGLLQSTLGGGLDSLHTTERLGVGDIEVGAQFLVFDQFQHDSVPRRGLQSRLMVGGSIRLPTSRPDSAQNLVDIATGDGAGFELRSALDMVKGHLGGTMVVRYVKHLPRTVNAVLAGDPDAPGWPYPLFAARKRTAGDVVALDVTPRFLFGEWLSIDGHYGVERIGPSTYDGISQLTMLADPCIGCVIPAGGPSTATRTAQRLGLGLRYSTVDAYSRGQARYPIEMSFTHLETTRGDPGVPKISRDQIQMRLFLRALGR